jgi:hypothetical protein
MSKRQMYFKRAWRQYRTGDFVPDSFDAGMIGTMLQVGIIGCPAPGTSDCPTPANKMVKAEKVRRKAV